MTKKRWQIAQARIVTDGGIGYAYTEALVRDITGKVGNITCPSMRMAHHIAKLLNEEGKDHE